MFKLSSANAFNSIMSKILSQSQILTTLYKKSIENIVEKGENAGDQHFLLFL